ncbi:uncharacterized protein isoform X1 [Danio rerio]|uniref:Uncharacterized protein isoform X1 n=1 Tax=Danio rerio TaxID=7955 RepID=A0AC58IKM8_DANRE
MLSYERQKTRMAQSISGHTHVSRDFEGSGCQPVSDAFTCVVPDAPLAVVEEILLYLPAYQVVRVCRLVCHEWKELVDSAAHWRERCRREGIQLCDASRPPEDWCQFYFITKKRRNLIKNPKAEAGLQGWGIKVDNKKACWLVEENRKPFPDNTVTRCYVASDGLCLKRQLIDLQKEGYSAAFMDQLQPHIKISDWYTTNLAYGSSYQVCMELLNEEMQPISSNNPHRLVLDGENYPWCEITRVFQNYGPGVRFIRFTHGGSENQFWKCRYEGNFPPALK